MSHLINKVAFSITVKGNMLVRISTIENQQVNPRNNLDLYGDRGIDCLAIHDVSLSSPPFVYSTQQLKTIRCYNITTASEPPRLVSTLLSLTNKGVLHCIRCGLRSCIARAGSQVASLSRCGKEALYQVYVD